MSYLTEDPIDSNALIQSVLSPERGGVATFLGVVRNHHEGRAVADLDYTAYQPMADSVIAGLVAEAAGRWPVTVAVRHRLGTLAVGDIAVAVVVAADHRDVAFEACRHLIEEIKSRVPIWKRERYADGTEAWVDPTAPGALHPIVAEGRPRR